MSAGWGGWRPVTFLIVAACLGLVVLANAHLVHVALDSQPDCVPHARTAGEDGTFRAARSAC